MTISKIAGIVLSSAAMVAGHGYVSGAVVDGSYYGGYIVTSYPYTSTPPDVIGWSEDATDLGFVAPSSYSSGDIICHKDAQPGALSAEVKAGGSVELQWTEWPESHRGPVITYLANCNGDCSSVDKTALDFFKIDESGLIDGTNAPGTWASDNLIANNNSWTVNIPSSIAAGNYVLRHEIIALHSAGNQDGAQNYPQCINLKVTGGGSDTPTGTLGTSLYTASDPGILVNIYQSLSSYEIPGPALYSGASSGSATATAGASTAAATSAATPTVSATSLATASVIKSSSVPTYYSNSSASSISYSHSQPQQTLPATPSQGGESNGATVTQVATAYETDTAYQTGTAYETDYATATVTAPPRVTRVADTGSSGPETSSSAAASSTAVLSGSSLTEYLNSLTAAQCLEFLRGTLSWLVSDNKVHARDLSA